MLGPPPVYMHAPSAFAGPTAATLPSFDLGSAPDAQYFDAGIADGLDDALGSAPTLIHAPGPPQAPVQPLQRPPAVSSSHPFADPPASFPRPRFTEETYPAPRPSFQSPYDPSVPPGWYPRPADTSSATITSSSEWGAHRFGTASGNGAGVGNGSIGGREQRFGSFRDQQQRMNANPVVSPVEDDPVPPFLGAIAHPSTSAHLPFTALGYGRAPSNLLPSPRPLPPPPPPPLLPPLSPSTTAAAPFGEPSSLLLAPDDRSGSVTRAGPAFAPRSTTASFPPSATSATFPSQPTESASQAPPWSVPRTTPARPTSTNSSTRPEDGSASASAYAAKRPSPFSNVSPTGAPPPRKRRALSEPAALAAAATPYLPTRRGFRTAAAGGGGGDDPFAYVNFRWSSSDVDFGVSIDVAEVAGEEAAVAAAQLRMMKKLQSFEDDAMKVAQRVWDVPDDAKFAMHMSFGSATLPPSQQRTPNIPLPQAHRLPAFLKGVTSAPRIIILGVDGLTNDIAGLYSEFACVIPPDVEIAFSSGATEGEDFVLTGESLKDMCEQALDGGLREGFAEGVAVARGGRAEAAQPYFVQVEETPAQSVDGLMGLIQNGNRWRKDIKKGCLYVGTMAQVAAHQASSPSCFGQCSAGCGRFPDNDTVRHRRFHMSEEHPHLHLCEYKDCARALSSKESLLRHLKAHEEGHLFPNGLRRDVSGWITEERALSRPLYEG
ncbi:hypothetical protein JCM10207_008023 [Rhodosporidiobolus poonsookiae]